MGQKVHPRTFRLGVIDTWNSKWFSRREYSNLLREDIEIRKYVSEKLRESGVARIEIERSNSGVTITINTSRPGMVIGRGGASLEQLKKGLLRFVGRGKGGKFNLKLNIQEVLNPDQNAQIVVKNVIEEIEKRLPFRRVMKHTIDRVMRSGALGAKVMLAGRLNGAEIARTEKLASGTIPLQTIRADIDYARGAAKTTYGTIGAKVWIYRGEIFEKKAGSSK